MQRVQFHLNKMGENEKIDLFIADIIEVYKKHNMTIGHEDHHGSFCIELYDEYMVEWMRDATDCITGRETST